MDAIVEHKKRRPECPIAHVFSAVSAKLLFYRGFVESRIQVGDAEVCRVVHAIFTGFAGFHLEYELVHGTQSGKVDTYPRVKNLALVSEGNLNRTHAHAAKTSVDDNVTVVVLTKGRAVCIAVLHCEVAPCGIGYTSAEQGDLAIEFDIAAGGCDIPIKFSEVFQ